MSNIFHFIMNNIVKTINFDNLNCECKMQKNKIIKNSFLNLEEN